ncbi:hypothetical protein HDU76_007244 [Blyttiomyces sp. JEL0837]|nr:hypothetical protein HDU76_007244 [Blyttiomyces sp. JEL0837]
MSAAMVDIVLLSRGNDISSIPDVAQCSVHISMASTLANIRLFSTTKNSKKELDALGELDQDQLDANILLWAGRHASMSSKLSRDTSSSSFQAVNPFTIPDSWIVVNFQSTRLNPSKSPAKILLIVT